MQPTMVEAKGGRRLAIGVIFATIMIDFIGFSILIPVLPRFEKTLGIDAFHIGLITALYALGLVLFELFTGRRAYEAKTLNELGQEAECAPVGAGPDAERYDAVVLGSAVYVGSWMKEAASFARGNAGSLAQRPVWLFSSGPLGTDVDDADEQPREMEEIRNRIGPRDHRVFFGALDPEKLGFGERMVVKAVRAPTGDFRDWDDIRAWTEGIAAELGGSTA